jgi:hypothetical protein
VSLRLRSVLIEARITIVSSKDSTSISKKGCNSGSKTKNFAISNNIGCGMLLVFLLVTIVVWQESASSLVFSHCCSFVVPPVAAGATRFSGETGRKEMF